MKRGTDKVLTVLLILLLLFIAWRLGFEGGNKSYKDITNELKAGIIFKTDTLIIKDTVVIKRERIVPKIIRDTVWKSEVDSAVITGFRACYDTTFENGSLNVCFSYPITVFDIDLRVRRDTVKVKETIIKVLEQNKEQKADKWIERAMWGGGGLLIGLVIGVLLTK